MELDQCYIVTGSSAAYSTCVAASLLIQAGAISRPMSSSFDGPTLTLINNWALVGEKIIHERPSGKAIFHGFAEFCVISLNFASSEF